MLFMCERIRLKKKKKQLLYLKETNLEVKIGKGSTWFRQNFFINCPNLLFNRRHPSYFAD